MDDFKPGHWNAAKFFEDMREWEPSPIGDVRLSRWMQDAIVADVEARDARIRKLELGIRLFEFLRKLGLLKQQEG